MNELVCPATGELCDNTQLCGFVNEPLERAIPQIRQNVGGVRWNIAESALRRSVETQANLLAVDLPINFDRDGTATVCPDAILSGEFGNKHGQPTAATATRSILSRCVAEVTDDLQSLGAR